jgi:hypothetical protein
MRLQPVKHLLGIDKFIRIVHNGVTFLLAYLFDNHINMCYNIAFARPDQRGIQLKP